MTRCRTSPRWGTSMHTWRRWGCWVGQFLWEVKSIDIHWHLKKKLHEIIAEQLGAWGWFQSSQTNPNYHVLPSSLNILSSYFALQQNKSVKANVASIDLFFLRYAFWYPFTKRVHMCAWLWRLPHHKSIQKAGSNMVQGCAATINKIQQGILVDGYR